MNNRKNPEKKIELLNYKGSNDGIEYEFAAKILPKGQHSGSFYPTDTLQINYVLTNTSGTDYLLFNRGHHGTNESVWTYVEALDNGTIQIAQKAFEEPTGKRCPDRYMPITPKGAWLKAGQKIVEQTNVSLPLTANSPFDDCLPKSELPEVFKGIRFCLGYAEADSRRVKIDAEGVIDWANYKDIDKQKLLCSETVKMP